MVISHCHCFRFETDNALSYHLYQGWTTVVAHCGCLLGNHSPQFGCPGLIPDGIIVSLHLQTIKNTVAHWATKVPTLVAQ